MHVSPVKLVVLCVVSVMSCGRNNSTERSRSGSSCSDASAHIAKVLIGDVAGLAPRSALFARESKRVAAQALHQCERNGWSDATRDCYLAARTFGDLKRCSGSTDDD